jgi:hypothetical protein
MCCALLLYTTHSIVIYTYEVESFQFIYHPAMQGYITYATPRAAS